MPHTFHEALRIANKKSPRNYIKCSTAACSVSGYPEQKTAVRVQLLSTTKFLVTAAWGRVWHRRLTGAEPRRGHRENLAAYSLSQEMHDGRYRAIAAR